jgi:hypothetical protein
LLNERAREISNKSDAPNRANLELGQNEVNSEWNGLIAELENRKETLTKLAEHWEVRFISTSHNNKIYNETFLTHQTFESKWQQLDSKLLGTEVKLKHEDLVVRNKIQIQETCDNIKVC